MEDGICHEKALVLRCITVVILILKQGTKCDHNGAVQENVMYVQLNEILKNKYTIMQSCKVC